MKWITRRELSAMLGGRSRSALYCDMHEGRLPRPTKLGGRNLWPLHEIEGALARLREGGSHEPRG